MKHEFSPEAIAFYARVAADQAAKQQNKPTDTTTVIARYLAIGGAHIDVNKVAQPEQDDDEYEYDEPAGGFTAACESCGPLQLVDRYKVDFYRPDGRPYYNDGVAYAETTARQHSETCRRIPERLWTNSGPS